MQLLRYRKYYWRSPKALIIRLAFDYLSLKPWTICKDLKLRLLLMHYCECVYRLSADPTQFVVMVPEVVMVLVCCHGARSFHGTRGCQVARSCYGTMGFPIKVKVNLFLLKLWTVCDWSSNVSPVSKWVHLRMGNTKAPLKMWPHQFQADFYHKV